MLEAKLQKDDSTDRGVDAQGTLDDESLHGLRRDGIGHVTDGQRLECGASTTVRWLLAGRLD